MVFRAYPMGFHQAIDAPSAAAKAQFFEVRVNTDSPIVRLMAVVHVDNLLHQYRIILGSFANGSVPPVVITACGDIQLLAHG